MNNKVLIKNSAVILAVLIVIALVVMDNFHDKSAIIFILVIAALAIWLINWKSARNMKFFKPVKRVNKRLAPIKKPDVKK